MNIEDRFWSKIDVLGKDDCWNWLGYLDKDGYGQFSITRQTPIKIYGKYTAKKAHRLGWELIYGPIPKKILVCHSCDNPPCCNPEHLFLGTQLENMQDAVKKGRLKGNTAGVRNHWAKLTEEDVLEIRRLYQSGNYSCSQLEQLFNMSSASICRIYNYKTWKHLK